MMRRQEGYLENTQGLILYSYKQVMKSLPRLKKEAQVVFNEFIRLRDSDGASHFKCISCGQIKPIRFLDCGHFYNVGFYDGLRYNEDNAHGQCSHCNRFLHGNLIEYQQNLLLKLGPERFEKLKIMAGYYKRHGSKYTRYELSLLITLYREKIAVLKRELDL